MVTRQLMFTLLATLIRTGHSRPSQLVNHIEDFEIPTPKHKGFFGPGYNAEVIATRIANWSPLEKSNIWELSGLHEGDIMKDKKSNEASGRNAVRDPDTLWTDATIPYIFEPTFLDSERKIIREGMDMIESETCFKFRPFKIGDLDFVLVQGAPTGCWSYVGKRGGGQVLNLQRGGCVHKGVVAHEFLHAAGFFHQQSAFDRDEYVFINYTNIQEGRENNFAKYNDSIVTDYDVGYDYGSIMHYSRQAFSKNGEDTIVPLKEGAEIGNREKVSDKDLDKLRAKYACSTNSAPQSDNSLFGMFGNVGSRLVDRLYQKVQGMS